MNPWMQATGWTLIHFVWQGGLLALATAVGLRLCRRRSSEARYAIACAGLTAMLAAPVVTTAFFRTPDSALVSRGSVLAAVPGSEAVVTVPRGSTDEVSSPANAAPTGAIRLDAVLPVVVWGWLAGVTALLARFAGGCWRVHRLRAAALAETVSQWQSASERLAVRLRLDVPFRVVESGLVEAPGVVGWIRPVILLPVAILANLTPVQIEAILAHELAHIRRRDYAVNLLQTVAETLLFYHPAVWWVSARVREEREHCCDDAAVEVVGEPAAYAQALAELASWRSGETALAVGATGGSLLARIRRLLHEPDDDPRPVSGLVVLALGISLAAGLAIQSSSSVVASDATMQRPSSPRSRAGAQAAPGGLPPGEWRIHKTDHFDIYYRPDQDLHAERVGREAERAHDRVSSDLKHNLAFQVPIMLVHTANELEQAAQAGRLGPPHVPPSSESSRDRIVLAMDQPADRWYGLIAHEVTHLFTFDIIPGTATPRWIMEGLAEYERGEWDPGDLVTLRDAVRANAIPKMSALSGSGGSMDPRLIDGFGHAAFDFIESRWGKPGMRQFIFGLRQTAINGSDPYQSGLRITRDEFDGAFEQYLKERFAGSAGQIPAERFDYQATVRIEGTLIAINSSVPIGRACIEVWALAEEGIRRRWAVECGDKTEPDVMRALRPGDHVIVTGPPARRQGAQRMVMQSLVVRRSGG